uniref:Uncharacterized protein n=1 Tax=Rhizophora mucronata TaxID=61149 RepID=A0A2P2NUF0_RHIMU
MGKSRNNCSLGYNHLKKILRSRLKLIKSQIYV